uniref:Uncharacterized protein n=1 Tax=Acanthochromis polyacanthus TaxID=80966 RepID=A0A3Q1G3X6_9TELE
TQTSTFILSSLSIFPPPPVALMSVTVFPVRLLLVSFFMLLAWPFAFAASLGRSEFVIEPQSWWRRCVGECLCVRWKMYVQLRYRIAQK